jgi:hypothetical protein
MPRTYVNKPARLLRRPAKYARIDLGSEEELRQLGRSYLDRPINPIIVTPDLEIIDGNRRDAGVMLIDPDAEVPVCITDEPFTPSAQLEIQVESAAHTRGLSDFEEFLAIDGWLALNPDATAKQFAQRIHRDEAIVSKIGSLSRCIDAVKDAAKAGLLGYTKWHEIAQMPQVEQAAALAAVRAGATRAALQRHRRRNGNGQAEPKEKAARIKIPLAVNTDEVTANGVVTVASLPGEEIDLDSAQDLLEQALKAIRDAKKRGITAKTFARAMKDMAEAGA